ncbi:MAG: thiolase family protein [Oceanicaulis sp.]|uniref:thiolase family protein n=1 Tax=Glycocaulis sp. TaxID=1969725 RepID=UPI0025C71ECE|nr:thiolase family protein [Glycocaulis sp.]MCC5981935.1 thiolase family protein [Oceanicaulis sp.]MCH8521612.1 thiolase family protein [Glycocaulis sp.]
MSAIFITGTGMTRLGKHIDRSVKDLVREAVTAALDDAGLTPDRIEAAFFANTRQPMLEGQNAVRGEIALAPLGIEGIAIVNVENACASGSSAVALAASMIRAGEAETVLVVGAEKMVFPDRTDQVMAAFRGGTDIEAIEDTAARMEALGRPLAPKDAPSAPRSFFMDIYAGIARAHMEAFGTTREQIAAAAAKNHTHAVHNPKAQYRTPFTVDEVLADKPVVWPLTRAMCAPVSDGAAAILLQAESAVRDRKRAVRLAGQGWTTATSRDIADWDAHLGKRAADRAWEASGLGPEDMDTAEVHDATSFAEILQIENLGLCPRGQGGPFTASGATRLGGSMPVNVTGGLVAKGHPVGATGIIQLAEMCAHLRGEAGPMQVEGASAGVCENGGGFLGVEEAVTLVTVLTR